MNVLFNHSSKCIAMCCGTIIICNSNRICEVSCIYSVEYMPFLQGANLGTFLDEGLHLLILCTTHLELSNFTFPLNCALIM